MALISREQLDRAAVVWIARVSEAPLPLASLDFLLDDRDRERAARFHFAEDRTRFVLGRSLVRYALGLCLDRKPETIRLAYANRDRPFFSDDESLHFSISHTHDIVAVAFTANDRVGVDVEFVKTVVDLPELAERIFSADDLRKFQVLPQSEAASVFFRTWTRKEAYLKARGEGIGAGLQAVSVSFGGEEISPLTDSRDLPGSAAWRIHDLAVAPDYRGALACEAADKEVICREVKLEKTEGGPEIHLASSTP